MGNLMRILKKIVRKVLIKTSLKMFIEENLFPKYYGLLFMNWFCQRLLGINNDMPFLVHFTSQFVQSSRLHLGEGTWKSLFLSGHIYIQAGNGVYIGGNCMIAPGVKIISANHSIENPERNWLEDAPIRIGKNCWLGTNVIILPGVVIGDRAIIGAGAVVTHDLPSNSIVAGNPARVIRSYELERNP
ncbi:MAG: acyltransferase [Anaerolineaceae bacterium]|nr:MAG: acyltransferase [Anaerolineaceae bacterium]